MRINTEVRASIVGLLLLQVVTSFAAIALLARLGPAIAQILQENDFSVRAVEQMQQALAARGAGETDEARSHAFGEALSRARSNITEPGEEEHIQAIEASYAAAIAGDAEAIAATLHHVEALGEINHGTMVLADERATRLAEGGSWAAVVLALAGLGLGLLVARRLTRRVVVPLVELDDAVARHRAGDAHRRARIDDAPAELLAVTRTINALLDEKQLGPGLPERASLARDRAALLHLLDAAPEPTLVVEASGAVLAASRSALEALGADQGPALRERIDRAARGEGGAAEGIARLEEVEPGLFLVSLERPGP